MSKMEQPVTEAINSITEEIDVSSPLDIVSLLQRCDEEMFNGFKTYKSLFHKDIIQTIEDVAVHVKEVLADPENGVVVFSGCGTSGRIGFIVARTFNELLQLEKKPLSFQYLLAGGDRALFTSQEAPEDDPRVGVEALKKVSRGKSRVVFVGITCGLSAPYVGGQLEYCMDNPETFVPVLLGFNPSNLARNVKIETWDKTFLQVVQRLETWSGKGSETGYLLNPIVGPEPITGSSRMKGGSATKMVIESICMKALSDLRRPADQWKVGEFLKCYRAVCDVVYKQKVVISKIIEMAGNSLSSGGSIYYLGNDGTALMGLIDASECPPTYGATLDDVRGFVESGYSTLKNNDGDLTHLGKQFGISTLTFVNEIELSDNDTVIVINRDQLLNLPQVLRERRCKTVLLTFEKVYIGGFDTVLHITLPSGDMCQLVGKESVELANGMFCEIATKWCLNAVSTGAHILKGKVYRNMMIDVKVSNSKLFHRAVGILERLGHLSKTTATNYLLRSIYNTDVVTDDIQSAPVAQHILTATPADKVVPTALLAAVLDCPIADAKLAVSKQPVVRSAIAEALKTISGSI